MKVLLIMVSICTVGVLLGGCGPETKEQQLEKFIKAHVAKIDPLNKETNLVAWEANIKGKAEDYEKLKQLEYETRQIYSNPEEFALLKDWKESGEINDPLLARQLDILYRSYLRNQIEPELLKKLVDADAQIREKYNNFRGTIDGRKVNNTEIYEILTTEKDSAKREKAWRASKQVGEVVVHDLITLVKLRNEASRRLGFDNYHSMSLSTGEQSVARLDKIFAELMALTDEPYARVKAELDEILAADYGIEVSELMPWHYHDPFFQRGPLVYDLDLDDYYKNCDVKEVAQRFYEGINLSVKEILASSDLYDREGKNPHAFSMDVDRHGDVRVLCNLDNTERWMETILHELGHAVYDKYHDPHLPYLLREPAHSFTTEALAMFFGRLSRNAAWMRQMLNLSDQQQEQIAKVSRKYLQVQQLIFARWAMVMYSFEKQLYADPDQDLNNLWWDLVEKYQMVQRPPGEADAGWASKLHFTGAPCYYHNYMLGELLASQWHHYIVNNVLRLSSDTDVSYVNQKQVGDYFREKVITPSNSYHWDEMISRSTGEPLSPKFFVEQFVK